MALGSVLFRNAFLRLHIGYILVALTSMREPTVRHNDGVYAACIIAVWKEEST